MKINQIKEGVGRITKQNQTADVGPDEVKTQAAKFGNSVDKDGRPPTLSKKVKGSKTNVLYNLGLAESVQENVTEDEKELSQESEIYVDMDGVLADFFGAWKKLIGKDWRNIDNIDDALQRIRDKDDFWLTIPKTENAMNLLGLVKKLKGKYNILSAPLANDPNSEPHKREWIKKHLKAFPPSKVIITADKAKYATTADGTPNILIDDFGQNINKWVAAGGVGFKHKDHKFERTVKNLASYMKSPAKESYTRNELPQIGKKELKGLWHTKESVAVKDIIPVQKERIQENYAKQLRKIASGNYKPIVVDCENKIINGHHRYDIIKKLAVENVTVIKLPLYLENLVEGNLLANPQNSILVKKDDNYDWYRIGTNMANIKDIPTASVPAKNKPDIYIQFYGGEKEKKYMTAQLQRLGYDVQDADGYVDPHFDEATENSYVLRIRKNIDEVSAKDIGAGALAGLMALTPVSKAFGQDANTNPLPNKQTSTMVQKDVAGKKDLSKIQAPVKNDYWKVTINYKGKDVDLKLPFDAGTNKKQIKQFVDDMMSERGIKDYAVKDIDTLNKVKLDPVKLKKVINQLKIKNGKQSSSYLANYAEKILKVPHGQGNAYATAAQKAYFGLK